MCNLIMNTHYRARIRDKVFHDGMGRTYLVTVLETISMNLDRIDEKRLEKISHMTTLIAYHSDMLQRIIETKMLAFIIKLMDPKYSVTIRSNAVLAISLLTYHEMLFDELIS